MGFIRGLMKAGSVRSVDTAIEHVGLFYVATKADVQRYIADARANNRHVFEHPVWTVAHKGRTLSCRILWSASGGSELVCGISGYEECVSSDAQSWLAASVFFALSTVLPPEVGHSGKTVKHFQCFFVAMFYCEMSRIIVLPQEVLTRRDHSAPLLLGSRQGTGLLGFRWSCADNVLGFGSRRELHQRSSRTSHDGCKT